MDVFTGIYAVLFFFGIFFIMIFFILHKRNESLLFYSPPVTNYPSVSILVPAYNEEKSLENTICALTSLKYPKNKIEIIIIDDGSKDATPKIADSLAKRYSNVEVIHKSNSGKANSLNVGIKQAKGELIAVADADSYPNPDALAKMVGHFNDSRVAAVTSRVLVKNKSNWICKFQDLDYSIIAWTRKLLDFVDSVYVTNGPLSVYRKKCMLEAGGFDPKNLTEDIEITWHLLSLGYMTRMSYSAIVYTTVPESLKVWTKQRVRWNLGGIQTVQKYWRSMFTNNSFGSFVVPYVTASFALAIIGFLLMLRYLWVKGSYQFLSVWYSLDGYNPFKYIDFQFSITFLLIMGLSYFFLAIYYYKIGFSYSESKGQSILNILVYSFIYRALYIIPLIIAIYKLARGDLRWYTK